MTHTTFADLPPELVGNVFAFIRAKPEQGVVCLVSRAWRSLMAPIMWESLETDFGIVTPERLATLLHPNSGILSHVRELTVLFLNFSHQAEDTLRSILAAIPRDRIRCFTSDTKISILTIQQLLQSQRKIEGLHAQSTFTTPGRSKPSPLDSEEHHSWMSSSLTEISSITLDIKPHKASVESISNRLRSMSHHCPKVADLSLTSPNPEKFNDTSLCAILRHAKDPPLFSNLSALRLFNLRIAKAGDKTICKSLDLFKLRILEMDGCDYIVPFVEALSSQYTCGSGRLTELYIILPSQLKEPQASIRAIEKLLKVCPKLDTLQLELSRHGVVAKDYVLAHCQTLRTLRIDTGRSEKHHFSAAEMTTVLEACMHLDNLAVTMPAVDLGAITKLRIGFSPEGEFADLLTVVSKHPSLRAFRILNIPTVEFGSDDVGQTVPANRHVYLCQILMQNFANQVFRFMADRGSDLRVFIIKPSSPDVWHNGEQLDRDANGHLWPEYSYVRGRYSELLGTKTVVAHPVGNILLEFPSLCLLQY